MVDPIPDVTELSDLTDPCSILPTIPTATDNCSGTITATTTTEFPVTDFGTTVVIWNFDDGNGNIVTQNQNVIILDNINPEITCSADQVINIFGATTTYTVNGIELDPIYTNDNCEVASVINNYNSTLTLDGEIFTEGTYIIDWTVSDLAGNTATCTFGLNIVHEVGIDLNDYSEINTYPNPVESVLNIESMDLAINKIQLNDITGRIIFEISDFKQNSVINVSHLKNGIYLLSLYTEKGLFIKKIVKE
jgi:hypothetical protein